jgi:hypothetical protein
MSEQKLRTLLASASLGCELSFDQTGMVAPTWYAIAASGELIELTPPHPNKNLAIVMVRAFFELHDVIRYVFVDEAWSLRGKSSDSDLAVIEKHGVAGHADRVEVVMIMGEDRDAGMLAAHRRIIRPPHRRPYLAPLEMLSDLPNVPRGATFQTSGRMIGLLPPRGTRH